MESKSDKYWYPLYTKSRHEKKAFDNLKKAGYEVFLPLKKSIRKWSDRKKIVEMPLIASYVFVRMNFYEMHDVLAVYGVSRYISFNGRPAHIRDEEIEILQRALSDETEIETIDGMYKQGSIVHIKTGPFAGYSGKINSFSGKKKLVVELEALNKTLLITLDKRTDIHIT